MIAASNNIIITCRHLGCLLTPAVAGVIAVAYIAVQINFWEAAEKLKTDLQAERMANLDQAWAEYQALSPYERQSLVPTDSTDPRRQKH